MLRPGTPGDAGGPAAGAAGGVGHSGAGIRHYFGPGHDLNVITNFRERGIGSALIAEAERMAAEAGRSAIGIGVGTTPDYDAAWRLYPKLGYVSGGTGAHTGR
ncbi:MAG: GNAT family N-acetyltransferase [Gemmatimonadaceae bacterium]